MESVIRGLIVYFFLLFIFRVSGKRTLSQTTNFDLVLLLIISETVQQAMIDDDHSLTNGLLLVVTLVGAAILVSVLKEHFPRVEKILEGTPVVILRNGKLLPDCLEKTRVDEADIREAARTDRGLHSLDQVEHAVLERSGSIAIIPKEKDGIGETTRL